MFNEILVLVDGFILDERNRPFISDISDRISYYSGIVEEYHYLIKTLQALEKSITDIKIQATLTNAIGVMNQTMESYNNELIVVDLLREYNTKDEKATFFDKITKFEKSMVADPVIIISESSIQEVLVSGKIFAEKAINIYFFENNPYLVDEKYGIVVPVKKEYQTVDIFLNGLYNYLFSIYNTYKYQNADELSSMASTEIVLDTRVNEFQSYVLNLSNNKLNSTSATSPSEYYQRVNELFDSVDLYKEQLISMSIYRFFDLNFRFKNILVQLDSLKSFYYSNPLYVEVLEKKKFSNKLVELQDRIILFEKGIITVNTSFIVEDDTTFKDLVEEIINMSQSLKTNIYYTQQYNITGQPLYIEFAFYQTMDFLNSIQTYYYRLMTIDSLDFNTVLIEDFGDTSTVEPREIYTSGLAKYNDYVSQPVEYMVEFEIVEFIKNVEELQTQLKREAATFFNNAFETSPLTFAPMIEEQYRVFLDKLSLDISTLVALRNETDFNDELRDKALIILNKSIKYSTDLNALLTQSSKYSMIGMEEFIYDYLISVFDTYKTFIKTGFLQEDYARVIAMEEEFYKTSSINHNMLVSLTILANNIDSIFSHFNEAQNIFVDEHITKKPIEKSNQTIQYITHLFEGNMFEAIRQEMSSNLDNFYIYVIDKKPNEKPFLINEKNLKLSYFDNNYIKMNYIRLFDIITSINYEYKVELSIIGDTNETIKSFGYLGQLSTLIAYQNTIISNLAKTLSDQSSDVNFELDTVLETAINSITEFNDTITPAIEKYIKELEKYREINKHKSLVLEHNEIKAKHDDAWINILNNNSIDDVQKISYADLEVITGSVPFSVEMSADFDSSSDDLEEPEFIWDIAGETLNGKNISYIIYTEGLTTVKCSRVYPSGETTVRYIEFDISGPTNSQVVKTNTVNYSPIQDFVDQPMITYFDNESQTKKTIPLSVTGDVNDMIRDGAINVQHNSGYLSVEKSGFVVLGFEGIEISGSAFNYTSIFSEEFEMPEEADFLFDFQVSDPIANKSVIDIANSKFVEYMAKVPSSRINSVYDIEDASEFQAHTSNTLPILVGDIVIMKNKSGRFAVIEISSIKSETLRDEESHTFEIGFKINVNISLNKFEQTLFKPLTSDYTVPTIIFETNSKELFSGLIERLETINSITTEMESTVDNERKIVLAEEIKSIRATNEKFYLFSEYTRLKAKTSILEDKLQNIDIVVDYDDIELDTLKEINADYAKKLKSTRTFSEYMDETTLYDIRNNFIDLNILKDLYVEEQQMMSVILDTYDYINYDLNHFLDKFNNCAYIDKGLLDEEQYKDLTLIGQLPLIVKNARIHLFRLKLLINLPILVSGKYIIPNVPFDRLSIDINGEQTIANDMDLYLFNKKLELANGYENKKLTIEDGNIITSITKIIKETQGNCLSEAEITKIGTYIDEIERKCVKEYDDFFMLPYWMDYLTKLL